MRLRLYIIVVVIAALGIGAAAAVYASRQEKQERRQAAIIAAIEQSPDVSMSIDQSVAAPITIASAKSKVIDEAGYVQLTGLSSPASKNTTYITVPELKVINTSDRIVTQFTAVIHNKLTNEMLGIRKGGLKIGPGAEYVLPAAHIAAARSNMTARYQKNEGSGKFERTRQGKGLESAGMWLPGDGSNNAVVLTQVKFEDGTKWNITRQGAVRAVKIKYSANATAQSCVCSCGWCGGLSLCVGNCLSCPYPEECGICLDSCCDTAEPDPLPCDVQ